MYRILPYVENQDKEKTHLYIYLYFQKKQWKDKVQYQFFTNNDGYLWEGKERGKEQRWKVDTYFIHFTLGHHVTILHIRKQNSLNRKRQNLKIEINSNLYLA